MNVELKNAIRQGQQSLDYEHGLNNHFRFQIYRAMGPVCEEGIFNASYDATIGARRRVNLSILESRRVLPVWTATHPEVDFPLQSIQYGEDALTSHITRTEFYAGINGFESELLEHGKNIVTENARRAFYAACCCERLLACVLMDWADGLRINWLNDTDEVDDLEQYIMDPYVADSAFWAHKAESSLRFWEWWLTEAVPQAYDSY